MQPGIFIRSLEEQLRRVKIQYTDLSESSRYFDISPDELMKNAQTWFLRTILNTELTDGEIKMPALEYVCHESIVKEKIPPFNLRNPSLTWMICSLDKEQIDGVFGVAFYEKIASIAKEFKISSFGSTFVPERRK